MTEEMKNCSYCSEGALLDAFGIKIGELPMSKVILFKEQSHKGRIIVACKKHVDDITQLTKEERIQFMEDVNHTAEIMHELFHPDKINFGEFSGYFAVECGNVLGLGGAFFAALLGVSALAKEERDRTAEFLLTHPIPRASVVAQKLAAVLAEILCLNLAVALVSAAGSAAIGETLGAGLFFRIFLGYLLLQTQIACVLFGVSAFLTGGGLGLGLGAAFVLYFFNILANLTDGAAFLRYLTPFSYADGTVIVASGGIEIKYLVPGLFFALAGVAAAFFRYCRKDIRA